MKISLASKSLQLLVIVAATVSLASCSKSAPQRGTRSRDDAVKPIKVEAVRQDQVRRSVDVVGTLAAADQVTVASQADGTVSRILADLGDRVHDGQVMVELDREKLQYAVDNQKAALGRALAKYGATEPRQLPPIEKTPDVQKAAAELAQARQSYDRAKELESRQLVPRQSLDDAEATLRSKEAAYDSSLQNAKNLAADIDANAAMLKLAERELRDASIRAPFDGYVQKRLVSIGDFVKAQAPVMTVVRMDTLKATGEIPEKMAPWVQAGQTVELTVDAFPNKKIEGTVSRISPAVNTSTRAFAFEATVPNGDHLLKPGTFARVHLPTTLVEPVLTIPYGAMQYRYGVYRAFTVNGDRLALHELKTGDRVGDRMEILDGVALNDQVAMTDVDNLADGQRVTLQGATRAGGRGKDADGTEAAREPGAPAPSEAAVKEPVKDRE
jgi:multidrug efflux pump subunit AcrA (membrane-fusion protein)